MYYIGCQQAGFGPGATTAAGGPGPTDGATAGGGPGPTAAGGATAGGGPGPTAAGGATAAGGGGTGGSDPTSGAPSTVHSFIALLSSVILALAGAAAVFH